MISLQIYSFFSYITTILLFFLIVISCFVFRLFKKDLPVICKHPLFFPSPLSMFSREGVGFLPLSPPRPSPHLRFPLHRICASPFSLIAPRPSAKLPFAAPNLPYCLIPFLYSVSYVLLSLIFRLFLKKMLKKFGGELESVYLCTRFRGANMNFPPGALVK